MSFPYFTPSSFLVRSRAMPLLRLCVLAVALLLSHGMSQAATKLNIGTVVWIGYGPFYVAESKDFFKKYDLSVKLNVFADPALIPPALAGGSIQGAMETYDQVIGQVAKGISQKVVMPIDYSNGGDAIMAANSITRVADLKGKKVGFNPLSPCEFLLSYALKSNGLTANDIQAVSVTPEAVPAAMASGLLAGVTYEPSVSQILGQGGGKKFHVLYSSRQAPGLIADVLVFNDKYIASNPKQIEGVIRAYLDGLAYMKSHPDESAKIIGKFMGISAAEVKEQLAGVYNIPLAEMMQAFEPGTKTTSYYTSGEIIATILKNKGQISQIPSTTDTIAPQFIKAIQAGK
ncbi:ABC transporter substrate-binding protein [uncultured Oxalicibacterium sp.]|uniref:ABC transporter substrate-binding protein n=1 Tax=uncultured Oxalicibacterium sp. TaxID=1168540 RepID=UPI0025D71558|nr:ABC transporter substrate-binding protein [uncultured Oxalicibacterium sp.]